MQGPSARISIVKERAGETVGVTHRGAECAEALINFLALAMQPSLLISAVEFEGEACFALSLPLVPTVLLTRDELQHCVGEAEKHLRECESPRTCRLSLLFPDLILVWRQALKEAEKMQQDVRR